MKKPSLSHSNSKMDLFPLVVVIGIAVFCLASIAFQLHKQRFAQDVYCGKQHTPSTIPPKQLASAIDYFAQGDYEFEKGDCQQAVVSYTKALAFTPQDPQILNNRAYAYMRLRQFQPALEDLNKALALRPDYVHALMNRADIHNFYYDIDRQQALQDYDHILAVNSPQEAPLCRKRLRALYGDWSLKAVWEVILRGNQAGCI